MSEDQRLKPLKFSVLVGPLEKCSTVVDLEVFIYKSDEVIRYLEVCAYNTTKPKSVKSFF